MKLDPKYMRISDIAATLAFPKKAEITKNKAEQRQAMYPKVQQQDPLVGIFKYVERENNCANYADYRDRDKVVGKPREPV